MGGGIEDNSSFLNENICYDPSLADGSNDGSQNMFLLRNLDKYI